MGANVCHLEREARAKGTKARAARQETENAREARHKASAREPDMLNTATPQGETEWGCSFGLGVGELLSLLFCYDIPEFWKIRKVPI